MDEGGSNNNININIPIPKGESADEGIMNATVDWRGRPSNPNKHGGTRAAAFVLGMYLSIYLSIYISLSLYIYIYIYALFTLYLIITMI